MLLIILKCALIWTGAIYKSCLAFLMIQTIWWRYTDTEHLCIQVTSADLWKQNNEIVIHTIDSMVKKQSKKQIDQITNMVIYLKLGISSRMRNWERGAAAVQFICITTYNDDELDHFTTKTKLQQYWSFPLLSIVKPFKVWLTSVMVAWKKSLNKFWRLSRGARRKILQISVTTV